jgi:hypothetical protein
MPAFATSKPRQFDGDRLRPVNIYRFAFEQEALQRRMITDVVELTAFTTGRAR